MDKAMEPVEYENCPYCGTDSRIGDEELGRMVSVCDWCGRPLLVCGNCDRDAHDCADCWMDAEMKRRMDEWERGMVGQIVYWKDPDGDLCSGYCKVASFRADCYVLNRLRRLDCGGVEVDGGEIEALDCEVERLSAAQQEKLLAIWELPSAE